LVEEVVAAVEGEVAVVVVAEAEALVEVEGAVLVVGAVHVLLLPWAVRRPSADQVLVHRLAAVRWGAHGQRAQASALVRQGA